jgi:asparagine synthase (glutamine-hydrolysing)
LSWSALAHVFTFLATPSTESIVAGIRKLDAGHQMVVGPSGRIDVRRYWDLRFDPRTDASEVQLAEELGALLEESVNLHLCSDVPLGAFLSGGLDSSAVVGLMSRLTPGRVKTFSIGFEDPRYDERPHARLAAETFGTEHHELVVSPHALDVIDDIVWHLDEPFGDSSAIPTYMVSELASEHVKVVLTGDGGDEIFGGYDKYVVEQREREVDRVPAWLRRPLGLVGDRMPIGMTGRRFLRHFALAGGRRYLDASTLFTRRDQASLFQPDVAAEIRDADPLGPALDALSRGLPPLSALQYCDVRGYLPLDILVKVDRMTMAHSIEARPPLLDHRLVEFAARIPATMQIRGGTTKFLFKQAVRPFVPPSTIDRPKQGFAVPLGAWFRGPWTGFAKDVLLSSTCRRRGIFAPAYLERLLRVNDQGRNMDRELWTLVSFELWCRAFLDGAPVERARPLLEAARPA